jgi:hypothetical protein
VMVPRSLCARMAVASMRPQAEIMSCFMNNPEALGSATDSIAVVTERQ